MTRVNLWRTPEGKAGRLFTRTCVRIMARPPQFRHDDEAPLTLAGVKQALKLLEPADRLHVLRWLLLYYDDNGSMRFAADPPRSRPRDT
jgi:hypothetical protein